MSRITFSVHGLTKKRMIILGALLVVGTLFILLIRHQSPSEQAISSIEQIEAAALGGEGREVCAALTPRAQQQLLVALANTRYAASDCMSAADAISQAIASRGSDTPSRILYRMDPAEVVIRGNRAVVLASTFPTPDGPEIQITLLKEGGTWKIDALAGEGLPG